MTGTDEQGGVRPARLVSFLGEQDPTVPFAERPRLIGVLEGAGIGSEVVSAALQVLRSVEQATDLGFELRQGGLIGETAVAACGQWLPEATAEFCADVFRSGGAILSGPGGGRYVYDLRRRFDLFCKFVPVRPAPELAHAGRIALRFLRDVDILIVRDNAGGVYQGQWRERETDRGPPVQSGMPHCDTDASVKAPCRSKALSWI
jgi:isocitrate/isopropylmalate dehydrogenase